MKAARSQLLCRSHNPFRPSLVLWQHFVVPHTPARFFTAERPVAEEPPVEPPTTPLQNSGDSGSPPSVSNNDASTETSHLGEKRKFRKIFPKRMLRSISIKKAWQALDSCRDYEGFPIVPNILLQEKGVDNNDRGPDESKVLPWLTELTEAERAMGGMNRLSLEISKFYEWAKPTHYELRARDKVKQQVRSTLQKQGHTVGLDVFGSERNGLALALSDIDFRIVLGSEEGHDPHSNLPPRRSVRRHTERLLYQLKAGFLRDRSVFRFPDVRFSRYPLLSLRHRPTTLDVQLVCCNDTSAAQAAIAKYTQEYPQLPQVYAVVRSMLKARDLGETFYGGFGAYPTVMMIVAAFRHTPSVGTDPAEGLCAFLSFWTRFDTSYGLSIEPPALFDKVAEPVMPDVTRREILEGKRQPLPPWTLCLRDPVDPTNDLGRKAASIKNFQATCRFLKPALERHLTRRGEQLLYPLLWNIVGPPDERLLERRRKLEAFGREDMSEGEDTAKGAKGAKGATEGEGDGETKPVIRRVSHRPVESWPVRQKMQECLREGPVVSVDA